MNVADKHIEAIKAHFRKQKEIDPDGHVNDWVILLHYQSLNGDGLYATIGQLQTIVAGVIEGHVENLSPEEARTLTWMLMRKVNA